ncbi:hypothetical protein TWF970_003068 [Orbilia oligospora]|uniref:Uncharacterized protein n=1 Tax=Orbilia oligospora TaxID=2813651 RepID=A0A7C8VP61_ORBOL|nr:hypothetical protein TWF970_003068 [Orbilia oligospora]
MWPYQQGVAALEVVQYISETPSKLQDRASRAADQRVFGRDRTHRKIQEGFRIFSGELGLCRRPRDVTFVGLGPGQASENRLCTNRVQARTGSSFWKLLDIGIKIIFDSVADPVAGEGVFKLGRNTGATFGMVNTVKDGVYILENCQTTKEWCVCIEDGPAEFSQQGDSGSLVFNTRFQAVGMIKLDVPLYRYIETR